MIFAYANAKQTMLNETIISFFFNARGEHLERSSLGLYRSLLLQILEELPDLQSLLNSLRQNAASNLSVELIKNLFRHAVKNLGKRRLTCFIDALDECEED